MAHLGICYGSNGLPPTTPKSAESPSNVLAEGLVCEKSRGDKTAIELFKGKAPLQLLAQRKRPARTNMFAA